MPIRRVELRCLAAVVSKTTLYTNSSRQACWYPYRGPIVGLFTEAYFADRRDLILVDRGGIRTLILLLAREPFSR